MPSKTPSPTIVATPAKEKESHTSPVGVRLGRSNTLTGELSQRLGGAILGEFDLNSPRNDMLNKTGKADTPESFSALASSDSGVKVPPWSASAPPQGACAWHPWLVRCSHRRDRPKGRPSTASGVRASRIQSRRFPRLSRLRSDAMKHFHSAALDYMWRRRPHVEMMADVAGQRGTSG